MAQGVAGRNFAVGITFLGSLIALGAVTLAIQSVPFLARTEEVEVRFPSVDNLQKGDDVLVYGLRIGQVDDIIYDPSVPATPIIVKCLLRERIPLTDKAEFRVRSPSPLGGRHLEITPGGGAPVGSDYKKHVGEASGDLFTVVENLVEKNQESVTETLRTIRAIVGDANTVREGLVYRLIQDSTIADSVSQFLDNLRHISDAIRNREGPVGAIVYDTELRDRLTSSVERIESITKTLEESLRGEEGIVGYLLHDKKAKEDLAAVVEHVRSIAQALDKDGEGAVARFLHSRQLADHLEGIVADVHEIVRKVRSGEGTLGQAINDPRAWDELVRVLVLARETIEDLREQAPVSTFANALFAVF
jgi:hypothetical protein